MHAHDDVLKNNHGICRSYIKEAGGLVNSGCKEDANLAQNKGYSFLASYFTVSTEFSRQGPRIFPIYDSILKATNDLITLLDAKATTPKNCEPLTLTKSASQSHLCMGEVCLQMQHLLDASYNKNEELCKQVQDLEQAQVASH